VFPSITSQHDHHDGTMSAKGGDHGPKHRAIHSFHDQVFGEKKRKWLAGGDVWWEEVVQMSHFTGPFNTEVNSIDPY
jgi:hypothetical protein